MKVIITGATGFVGNNLTDFLESNSYVIDKLSLRNNWTLPINGNVLIHLAGKAHDTANTSSDAEYFQVNTELTKQLFDQFLGSEIRDFFFFSSVKATADTVSGILDEENSSNPKTAYGKSKLAAEEYLLSKKLPAGKRLFIIRPCMIHGPGNKGNLNLLYKVVEKSLPWPLAAFQNQRSFLCIDNLNFLIEKMINSEIPSGIYNFADDKPLSTNELITIISRATLGKEKLWKIPKKSIIFLSKVGDFLKLPLNSESLKKLTENYIVSNSKIKNVLNIDHLPVNVEDGIKKTIQSFRQ